MALAIKTKVELLNKLLQDKTNKARLKHARVIRKYAILVISALLLLRSE